MSNDDGDMTYVVQQPPYRHNGGDSLMKNALGQGMCPYHRGAPIARSIYMHKKKHFCFLCQAGHGDTKPTRQEYESLLRKVDDLRLLVEKNNSEKNQALLLAAQEELENHPWPTILANAKELASSY